MAYFRRGALIERFTQTVTSGGVLTLLNNSTTAQVIVGALDHTITLPDATTCDGSSAVGGQKFHIINDSIGIVTVNKNGGALLCKLAPNKDVTLWLVNNSSAAGEWKVLEFLGNQPLHFAASLTPDSKIYIAANSVPNTDGTDTNTPPASSQIPSVPLSSHDLQTGVTSGASFSGAAAPTSTVGQYRRVGYTLLPSGVIQVLWSAESATIGGLANAGTVFAKKGQAIGWMEVVADGATSFRTAGSSSGIIENNVGGVSLVHRFGSGGGGGSGSGDANTFENEMRRRLRESIFKYVCTNIAAVDGDNLIDDISSTTVFDIANGLFKFPSIGSVLQTAQQYGSSFLGENANDANSGFLDQEKVELHSIWDTEDPAATYQVSRDGGLNWLTLAMERVAGSKHFVGDGLFVAPVSTEHLIEYPTAVSAVNVDMSAAILKRAVKVIVTEKSKYLKFGLKFNKIGSPSGVFYVSWVKDSSGSPSVNTADILATSSPISLSALAAGPGISLVDVPAILPPGTYWAVIESDAAYQASYSNGVAEVELQADSSGSYSGGNSYEYDGTIWSATAGRQILFETIGFRYKLLVKITSSIANATLEATGVFFADIGGVMIPEGDEPQWFRFSGSEDKTDFLITNFLPHAKKVKVHFANSGLTFIHPFFDIEGHTIKFKPGTFLYPGVSELIVKVEPDGGSGGNDADVAKLAALMAANGLGSSDASIDMSSAGVGFKQRSLDGTLWHIQVQNDGSILTTAL